MATYDLSDWDFGPLQGYEQTYGADLYARNKKTGAVERAYTFDMQTYGGPRYVPESMKAQVEADFAGQTFGNYDSAMAGSEVKYTPAAHLFPQSDIFDLVPGIALGVAAGAVGGLAFGTGPLAGAGGSSLGPVGFEETAGFNLSTLPQTSEFGFGGLGDLAMLDGSEAATSSVSATTSAASGLSGTDLLLASQAAPLLMGLAMDAPEMPAEDGAATTRPDATERNPSTANKERAMDLRRAAAERAANAAGAKRFANEADLLGQTGRTTQRRKSNVQRTVLGY